MKKIFEIFSNRSGNVVLHGAGFAVAVLSLVGGHSPIADRSEYTVIIADTFELQDGPNLVLRTDFHLSDIPVPAGVGPVSETRLRLVE